MSWPDHNVIREIEQFILNRFDQIGSVASRQVRTTNAALEKHISSNQPAVIMADKHNMARGMTRRESHLEIGLATRDGLTRNQIKQASGKGSIETPYICAAMGPRW